MTVGLTSQTFAFLKDLAANNTKQWLDHNRDRYEADFMAPAKSLVETLAPTMNALSPAHRAEARVNGSIKRINRDLRFSKDKTPYTARMHLVFWAGDHPNRAPGIHIVIYPDAVGYGAGQWGLSKPHLSKLHDAFQDAAKLAALDTAFASADAVGCSLTEETRKTVPKTISAPAGRETLFKRDTLIVTNEAARAEPEAFMGDEGVARITEIAKALAPLDKWLVDTL